MISERKFISTYTSFWNQTLPWADTLLRVINGTFTKYCQEISSTETSDSDRRAIINELGFRLFQIQCSTYIITEEHLNRTAEEVRQYIKHLSPRTDSSIDKKVSADEIIEAKVISQSLGIYFNDDLPGDLKFWPSFPGCGMIQEVQGDIINKKTLIEVKGGDRTFRITDIRQIITYLALNFSSKSYDLDQFTLLNPRRGTYYTSNIMDFVGLASGTTPIDLFCTIIDFLSSETHSR